MTCFITISISSGKHSLLDYKTDTFQTKKERGIEKEREAERKRKKEPETETEKERERDRDTERDRRKRTISLYIKFCFKSKDDF